MVPPEPRKIDEGNHTVYRYTNKLRHALIAEQEKEFGEDEVVRWLKAHPADGRDLTDANDANTPKAIVEAIDYYWGNFPHPQ